MTKVNPTVSKMETTTLTEQWQQGKLEDGFYFVKENDEIFISICSNHYLLNVLKDCEVLAPVPTYEEWEELQESNDGLSKLMFKSLMNKFVKTDEERERLEEENTELVTKCHRLEKLLKRCRDSVEFDKREALGGGADYQAKILSALLKEIDEVLK
jgi:predicted KAP-like P-loop ATPase